MCPVHTTALEWLLLTLFLYFRLPTRETAALEADLARIQHECMTLDLQIVIRGVIQFSWAGNPGDEQTAESEEAINITVYPDDTFESFFALLENRNGLPLRCCHVRSEGELTVRFDQARRGKSMLEQECADFGRILGDFGIHPNDTKEIGCFAVRSLSDNIRLFFSIKGI